MRGDGEAIPSCHEARALGFAPGRPRDQCWAALEERARGRLREHTGEILDWWAYDDPDSRDGRPSAVVFGKQGLCLATPDFRGECPVYVVSGYMLDPASTRNRVLEYRPNPAAELERGQTARAGTYQVDTGLSDDARGLLGNLPMRAQLLLQGPFTTNQRVEDCAWHYEGDDRRLTVFIVYLAGERTITLATGTKTIPSGHTDATAQWVLTCHQATVVGRRGM